MHATLFTVATIAASANAFITPFAGTKLVVSRGASSGLRMSADAMLGADVETFGAPFDPLNIAAKAGAREIELKHGRVAMLAVLGMFVQSAGIHMPDPVFSESKPIDAFFKVCSERPLAAIQVVAALSWIESVAGKQSPDKEPGDVGNFGDNFKPSDPAEYAALQVKELKNGRLAMLAFAGQITQELLTGQSVFEQLKTGHINPFGDGQGFF